MADVTIIIVNYQSGVLLARCLESLQHQDYASFDVMVADNDSTDHSMDGLPQDPRFHTTLMGKNLGFAKANNLAVAQVTTPWVVFLNPDTIPATTWLSALMRAARHYPDFDMFGSLQRCAEDPSICDGHGDIYHITGVMTRGYYHHPMSQDLVTGEVFAVCAAACMIRRDVFVEAGGFDEDFFCYNEDIDLGFRLRLQGKRALQCREAEVLHMGSAITGRHSYFSVYHGVRNRFFVLIKNMPTALLWFVLPFHVLVMLLDLLKQMLRGTGRSALQGYVDAVKGMKPMLKKRRQIQASRTISVWKLLPLFSYSPLTLLRRDGKVRPVVFPKARKHFSES